MKESNDMILTMDPGCGRVSSIGHQHKGTNKLVSQV